MNKIAGKSITIEALNQKLPHGFTASLGPTRIVRTGAIETKDQTSLFFEDLQRLRKTHLRVIDCLLFTQKQEWGSIAGWDVWSNWLISQGAYPGQYAFLNLPTEHLYQPKGLAKESEFFARDAAKLTDLFNVGGWEVYCRWINEEITAILQRIPLESLDTYTLEGQFKNFNHQNDSQQLRNLDKEVRETLLKMGSVYGWFEYAADARDSLPNLERRLIKARAEIKRLLQFQWETLVRIEEIIPIIAESHPELVNLNITCLILEKLMKNHLDIPQAIKANLVQEWMLVQLLNEMLGVVTSIRCNTNYDRTSIVFSVMMAMSKLSLEYPLQDLVTLGLHWPENVKDLNRRVSRLTSHEFEKFMAAADPQVRLVDTFQQTFLRIVEEINIPWTRSIGETQTLEWVATQDVNPEFLLLFPVFGHSYHKSKLIETDFEGNAIDLTAAGHSLAIQLFLR